MQIFGPSTVIVWVQDTASGSAVSTQCQNHKNPASKNHGFFFVLMYVSLYLFGAVIHLLWLGRSACRTHLPHTCASGLFNNSWCCFLDRRAFQCCRQRGCAPQYANSIEAQRGTNYQRQGMMLLFFIRFLLSLTTRII